LDENEILHHHHHRRRLTRREKGRKRKRGMQHLACWKYSRCRVGMLPGGMSGFNLNGKLRDRLDLIITNRQIRRSG